MSQREFSIAIDYRCPFAAYVCELTMAAIDGGAPWNVALVPFSLNMEIAKTADTLFADPRHDRALLALEVAEAVDIVSPDSVQKLHLALFKQFHLEGRSLYNEKCLSETLDACLLDPSLVFGEIQTGRPRSNLKAKHEWLVAQGVEGVPTLISRGRVALVRIRPSHHDPVATMNSVLDIVENVEVLNELKRPFDTRMLSADWSLKETAT